MSINPGDKGVTSVVAAGAQASIVLAGNGTTTREVWPVGNYPGGLDTQFFTVDDLGWLSLSTFDYRTSTESSRLPSTVTSNTYKARINVAATYQARLSNQAYDGNHLVMEVFTASPMTTLSLPSSLVLSSDKDGYLKVEVAFGTTGIIIKVLAGATVLYEKLIFTTIPNGATIKAERIKQNIKVYVNGVLVASESSQYFEAATGNQYPGVGTYSDLVGPSTGITRVTISGSSTLAASRSMQEYLTRSAIVQSTLSETARGLVKTGGVMKLSLTGVAWSAPTDFSDRSHTIRLNGTNVPGGAITGQNGASVEVSNVNVPNNSIITVHSYSNSSPVQNRTIAAGYLSAVLM